jgi:hypothetical protein
MDKWRFWMLGEFYNSSGYADMFSKLAHSRENGGMLNGSFIILGLDMLKREWHVWTDRFGCMHAYYTPSGTRKAISTYSPALHDMTGKSLDWHGITGFLSTGIFPQDRTYYEDIKIFRPASHYVFDCKGSLIKNERYWSWRHNPDKNRSFEETVMELDSIMKKVVASQSETGRIGVPISGGLDSRTIAACLDKSPRPESENKYYAFSYGYTNDSVETRIGRRVAQRAGLPFESHTITPYLFRQIGSIIRTTEGFQDINQCRQAAITDILHEKIDYVLGGHMGDLWLDHMGISPEMQQYMSNDDCIHHILHTIEKEGRRWLQHNVCQPQLGALKISRVLHNIVEEELLPLTDIEDRDFQIKACKVVQWVFRLTNSSLRMYQPGAFPKMPFYDTRFTDFIATVPNNFLMNRMLQIEYLKKFFPEFAGITWQAFDTDLYHYQLFHTLLVPKRAVKKIWRTIARQREVLSNWEVQLLEPDTKHQLHEWLLRKGLRLHEFVPPASIKELMDQFYHDPYTEKKGYTVSMLLTFSAWLELLS